ncbi:hypothetical protein G5I_04480 [Acromyrmex echinatior]|uniref:Uncharacterized protein n=1 Tax=Acromyrmex echinatior TaxID=103372 RepID=F4WFS1_ACREC|nr:hypothetical protein G5I_04480 [Acromyrmex echinatior]
MNADEGLNTLYTTAENLQVLQSTAGREKSESKERIEGSYTKYNGEIEHEDQTPDRREIQNRKKESAGIRKGKGRNDGVRLGERCVDWVSRRLENMSACYITAGAKRVNYITRSTKLRQMPPGGTDHRLSLLAIRSTLQERLLEALLDTVCPSSRTSALLSSDFPNKADPKGPRLVPPSETFSPKFLDLLNLNVNRALLDNLLQQLTRFEVSASVCDTFFEDVKVPLALNHITNVLLVKCEEMTRNIESGVKGYGYAAIQTDRRIKDAVEIAEGDAALRLVVDEET